MSYYPHASKNASGISVLSMLTAHGLAGLLCIAANLPCAYATVLPEGPHIVSGDVAIIQTGGDTPSMTIRQRAKIALVEWQAFDIGKHAEIHVLSGNVDSLLINRVVGPTESFIAGALHADGTVWLINQNGIGLGRNATIDAHGFLVHAEEIDPEMLLGAVTVLRADHRPAPENLGFESGAAVNVQQAAASRTVQQDVQHAAHTPLAVVHATTQTAQQMVPAPQVDAQAVRGDPAPPSRARAFVPHLDATAPPFGFPPPPLLIPPSASALLPGMRDLSMLANLVPARANVPHFPNADLYDASLSPRSDIEHYSSSGCDASCDSNDS